MILPADGIGLPRERRERGDLGGIIELEGVEMVARRKALDSREERTLDPAGEHEMAERPVPAQRQLGEGHPHLEGDAGFFGQDRHRPIFGEQREECIVNRANRDRSAVEMAGKIVPGAGMALVAVRKAPPTARTMPKRWMGALHARLLALYMIEAN